MARATSTKPTVRASNWAHGGGLSFSPSPNQPFSLTHVLQKSYANYNYTTPGVGTYSNSNPNPNYNYTTPGVGTYSCSCRGAPQSFCNASVGRSDVATREQPPYGRGENWQWWRVNLARKMRGNWYSTVASGECSSSTSSSTSKAAVNANVTVNAGVGAGVGAAAAAGCTWSLKKTVRTITSQCLLNRVGDAVVDHDSTCFQSCAQPKNISSPCFVDCFMANVLGPDGGSKLISPTDGIPLSTIEDAWNTAFAPAASGGCPNPDSAGTRQDV